VKSIGSWGSVTLVCAFAIWPAAAQQGSQPATGPKPRVDIVQTVGCVEMRGAQAGTWWLTRAAQPAVSREGVFTTAQVAEAKGTPRGSREFRLVGEADFLDRDGLLRTANRAEFTRPDQVNATGALREGRSVLVKGLLIEGAETRLNLLAVVALADTCQ